ncbi:MAG: hypothetical protein U5K00_07845 [Melioribacteraceae bacterium]|nr:hypothetical protein [Melioribacteraceae bacterium]
MKLEQAVLLDGSGFEAAGPKMSLCESIIDGSTANDIYYAIFHTSASAVDLNEGEYLAIRITNYSKMETSVKTGGSWSYISSTESSAALPVELSSFDAELVENSVKLNWETATEVNNYGFYIQRQTNKVDDKKEWQNIGFVEGHGTTNSPKKYSFIDANLPDTSEVTYRLKQIDNDGKYGYSKKLTVDISTITSADDLLPQEYSLSQNYPNPFNPVTIIKFGLPQKGSVDLRIYNVLGQEVQRLVVRKI